MNRLRATIHKQGGILIGLNGVAQSGKDTVGKILCQRHGFERLAFADALRQGLYDFNPIVTAEVAQKKGLWGWVGGQSDTPQVTLKRVQDIVDAIGWDEAKVKYTEIRELMQRYGTEAGRKVHGDECWTSIIEKVIEENPVKNYVITDMRFDNELQVVRRLGGLLVQIQREGVTSVNGHISDKILPEYMFDALIKNNGTLEDLERKVNQLVIDANPLSGRAGTESFATFFDAPLTKAAN